MSEVRTPAPPSSTVDRAPAAAPSARAAAAVRPLEALAAALPLLFFVYAVLLAPRPYYVFETDTEPDHYYNARLVLAGRMPVGSHHPGTPIYYLGALLLSITGVGPSSTQAFFDAGYLVVALATAGAMLFFSRRCLRAVPGAIGLLALALLYAWPSAMAYQNLFGAQSFVLPLGLPTLTLLWIALRGETANPGWTLALAGAGVGACLSIKMSFLPFAVAATAAVLVWAILQSRTAAGPTGRRPAILLAYAASAAGSYLFLTSPILGNVPFLWLDRIRGSEIRMPHEVSLGRFVPQCLELLRHNPPWAAAVAVVLAAFAIAAVRRVRARLALVEGTPAGAGIREARPPADAILVALLLVTIVYPIAGSAWVTWPGDDPGVGPRGAEIGVRFRDASQAALAIPFLVLWVAERFPLSARSRRLAGAFAGLILIWAAAAHVLVRRDFIRERLAVIAPTERRFSAATPTERRFSAATKDGRVAFWTGGSTSYLGAASFHFWGNYRYANDYFDADLIEWFPHLTFFRGLREMRSGRIGPDRIEAEKPRTRSRFGPLGDWIYDFTEGYKAAQGETQKTEEVFAGERFGVRVTEIAVPTAEAAVELKSGASSRLLRLAAHAFGGPVVSHEERIGPVAWTLIVPAAGASPDGR